MSVSNYPKSLVKNPSKNSTIFHSFLFDPKKIILDFAYPRSLTNLTQQTQAKLPSETSKNKNWKPMEPSNPSRNCDKPRPFNNFYRNPLETPSSCPKNQTNLDLRTYHQPTATRLPGASRSVVSQRFRWAEKRRSICSRRLPRKKGGVGKRRWWNGGEWGGFRVRSTWFFLGFVFKFSLVL